MFFCIANILLRKIIFLRLSLIHTFTNTHRILYTPFCPDKHFMQRMYEYSCSYCNRMWGDLLVKHISLNFAGANQTIRQQSLLPHRLCFALQASFAAVCFCVALCSTAPSTAQFCPRNISVGSSRLQKSVEHQMCIDPQLSN